MLASVKAVDLPPPAHEPALPVLSHKKYANSPSLMLGSLRPGKDTMTRPVRHPVQSPVGVLTSIAAT